MSPVRDFAALLGAGLTAPRPVVRRLIDARPELPERLALVGLAVAMQGMVWALLLAAAPSLFDGRIGGGLGMGGQIGLAALVFLGYGITVVLVYGIGRRFGGTGDLVEVSTAVAWHNVLTAALTPLQVLAIGSATPERGLPALGLMMLLAYVAANIWYLAVCVAEAHHFASAGRVAGALLGFFLLLGFVLGALGGGGA